MLIKKAQSGFTLIEFLLAFTITVIIGFLFSQVVSSAVKVEKRVTEVATATNQISRVWEVMADDLQHVVARPWVDQYENAQPAMMGLLGDRQSQSSLAVVSEDSHLLRFVRGGEKSFFPVERSNLHIVAYRITADEDSSQEDGEPTVSLWRDHWRPVDAVGEPVIKSRLLLESIKKISFRYLPENSEDVTDAAWVTGWPDDSQQTTSQQNTQQQAQLPLAIEITIDVEGFGEIIRLLPLVNSL